MEWGVRKVGVAVKAEPTEQAECHGFPLHA